MAGCPFASSRRLFLGGAAGGALAGATAAVAAGRPVGNVAAARSGTDDGVPFFGPHQGGIATPQQTSTLFASFDVVATNADDLRRLLARWTEASARLCAGRTADRDDSLDVSGMEPRRLTLTFGFGPTLFERDGHDRFGIARQRPAALGDLPSFNGDQLEARYSGGDILVQACADDQSVAFHAIRQLARLGAGNDAGKGYGGKDPGATAASGAVRPVVALRWLQGGFLPDPQPGRTARNLLGFKDGTLNPGMPHPAEISGGKLIGNGGFGDHVWVADDGDGAWMRGGTYLVFRRIRLSLEHWDGTPVDFQQQVLGRRKESGAPLSSPPGREDEFAPLDLDATDQDGNPVIADTAHARLASASANGGARILRRSYAYNDGMSMVAERWPPWRQGLEYDAGLLFTAYGTDPRRGFIPMFSRMAKLDMLNQFATHTGSAIFALPGGVEAGGSIGDGLFGSV